MEKGYHPSKCGWAIPCYDTTLCRLQTLPCALLRNKKCYMQESDEAVEIIGKLLKEEGEKET